MRARGFTMLEVLIALLIFSLGLVGLAALLTISVKTNHAAYLRTQATFLAQGMAERMRANPLGLWNSQYNLNSSGGTIAVAAATTAAPATSACTQTTAPACTYSQLAARDLTEWQYLVSAFMPNPSVGIACTAGANVPSSAQLLYWPPYSGTCEIQIVWTDISNVQDNSNYLQTFDWVFQP